MFAEQRKVLSKVGYASEMHDRYATRLTHITTVLQDNVDSARSMSRWFLSNSAKPVCRVQCCS